jgi:steroid delta-isomerase-like uncharacterized protein
LNVPIGVPLWFRLSETALEIVSGALPLWTGWIVLQSPSGGNLVLEPCMEPCDQSRILFPRDRVQWIQDRVLSPSIFLRRARASWFGLMKGEHNMSEQNKAISRRLFEQVWNKGDLAVLDELYAPDLVNHDAQPGLLPGIEGAKQFIGMYLAAFPDTHMVVEDQVAEEDKVVTRWTATGTHKGELMGIPPTGKQVKVSGITIDRLEGGKIVEEWASFDQLGMLQQIGVIPS